MQRYGIRLSKRLPSPKGQAQRTRTGQAVTNAGFLVSSPVLSGTLVTPQTALNFTSVFAAVNVISTDLASLPYSTFVRTGPESRLPAPDIFANRLLNEAPNEESNAFRFRQALMGQTLLWGNGYAEIVRNGRGQPVSLYPLNAALVQPRREDWTGKLYYLLSDTQKRILPENMLHVAGLGFDGLVGYSVIHMARQDVGLGMAATEFGAAFFGNHAQPGGILKTPRKLSPTARQNLRESIYQVHQGAKAAHHLMILEEGMDWSQTTMPLDDAQFLATRAFQRVEMAAIFRLPPHKIGDYSQSHLANVEESNRDYTDTTLLGWALAWENECDNKLLFQSERDRGIFWHHSFARLNRGNTAARTAYYQGMRNMGAMSADDIRASEGMNPIGPDKGGDKYLIQAQYVDLAKAGEAPPVAALPKPGPEPGPAKKEEKGRRFNENHGPDGKFAESDSGGGSSAGDSSSAQISAEDHAKYALHPDVSEQHEAHEQEVKDTNKDYDRQQLEVDRDYAGSAKDLEKQQAKEVKELEREHVSDMKALAREQAGEAKSLPKEQAKEVKDTEHDQKKDLERLDQNHKVQMANEPAETKEWLAREQARERGEMVAEHKTEMEKLQAEHKQAQENLVKEHAEAIKDYKDQHQGARESLAEQHADEKKDLAEEHAAAKVSLEDERKESLASADELHAENIAEVIGRLKDEESEQSDE